MNPTELNQDADRAVFLSFLKGRILLGKNFFFLPLPTCKGYAPLPSHTIPFIFKFSNGLSRYSHIVSLQHSLFCLPFPLKRVLVTFGPSRSSKIISPSQGQMISNINSTYNLKYPSPCYRHIHGLQGLGFEHLWGRGIIFPAPRR